MFWCNRVRLTMSFCLSVCLLRVRALCLFAYLLWSRLFVTRCSQLQHIRNEIFLHRHYLHQLPQIWHLHCNRHWTDFSFHFSVALLGFYFGVMYHLYYESQYIRQGTNFKAFSEFLFIPLSFILSPFVQCYLRQKSSWWIIFNICQTNWILSDSTSVACVSQFYGLLVICVVLFCFIDN